ncbi:hydantoinase/oxoprolinase family protein [Methanolobus profundi]|uniref:N-methylhydantoinase A/oxoprolinase/acetone carboxylase, beta subunit n=1 Tax=Methanolobus profundi TaxID=487685 RepID=A0A1I4T3G7_9EURY|nr:hydantoinase/oxoprolinase family protein [Methanolobus profundi]SFM71153.1 N-methylhydantoinase A/oxoprolinase/acetone carboxylase, beta subunit [Methanolobus profundi]
MQYSLGIDAGGTYTDAVIVSDPDRKVVASNKALTTYPNLLTGIENAIDGLDSKYIPDIKLVSVSTTLATNTILEKTGYPVALILIGKHTLPSSMPIEDYIVVKGGHNVAGLEDEVLDLEAVREYAMKVKDRVSAFAVSSYFSIRNPEHEIKVRDMLVELTGLPIVCGHELSQDLGAYERGVTAYLNAQLLPIADQFIHAILTDIKKRGIEAKLMMLKCDGSVIGIHEAMERPIESIFSGPAASLMGASFLSGNDTCAVIDVGGTSTDVSLNYNGLPELVDTGAVVGGWHTKVKAIRMETSAMGGDSHVWIKNRNVNIGPRRVVPLCLAAVKYPGFMDQLRSGRTPSRVQLAENVQPTKFFVSTGKEASNLSSFEKELMEIIGEEPVSLNDIFWKIGKPISPDSVDSLIQKRLVQAIGFTPTDVLHVLGEYTKWDREASLVGAKILARLTPMDETELCMHIKKEVAINMALDLMSFMYKGVSKPEIEKMIRGDFLSQFKMNVPVVLLGGPVHSYVEELNRLLIADIIVPEHAEVGNAVGALVGKGVKSIEILVKSFYKKTERTILVFSPVERREFSTYSEALEYATEHGKELIMQYMESADIDPKDVSIEIKREDITMTDDGGAPIETKFIFLGTALPQKK